MDDATEFRLGKLEKDRDILYGKVNALTNSQTKFEAKFETALDSLLVAVAELKAAVKELKARPADRWDRIAQTVISTLVAAAVAYFIGGAAR